MTMKYARLLVKFHNRGLLVLAFILVSAITLVTRAQAIETDSTHAGSAIVTATAPCATAKPSLDLSPGSQNAVAGADLTYTISVTNHDDKACDASSFDLTITYLPDGWTGDLSTTRLNLGPGTTGTASLTVSPADNSETDRSKLQVAISDAQVSMHAKTTTASLAIGAPTTEVANAVELPVPEEPDTGESSTPTEQVAYDDVSVPAPSSGRVERDSEAEIAEQLTQRLTRLLTAYNQASEDARANALDELVATTEERHELLASLIEDDPGAVLRVAVPSSLRQAMPAEARSLIEQHINIDGELEILYEDYEDGHARLRHSLEKDGERVAMHFEADPPELQTGEQVSAQGVYLDLKDNPEAEGAMALESGEQILTLAAAGGNKGGSNDGSPAPVENTLGEQKTLVILVNFQDNPAEPYTSGDAHDVVFGITSEFFMENSYQQTWLSGDVVGWYTIPLSSTVCDIGSLHSYANAAVAADAAVDLSTYSHLVYAFPSNACPWWGLSTVGGSPSRTDINGNLELHVAAHELGHAMGLLHAHALDCATETLGPNCNTVTYGDVFDKMGGSTRSGHYNAFQKERLGWLNSWASPPITTVQTDGTYTIGSFGIGGSEPKALKILKSTDPTTGQRTWYYVESRQATGFDSFLAGNMNALNGVIIHTGSESGGNTSYLLDMNPENDTSIWDWSTNSPLVVGQSFLDPESGLNITTEWVTSSEAAVTVNFGAGSTDTGSTDTGSTSTGSPDTGSTDSGTTDQATVALSTDQVSYALNEWVLIETKVTSGGAPVANSNVSIIVNKSDGTVDTGNVSTDANGTATYRLRLRKKDPVGIYRAAAATTTTPSGNVTVDFTVHQ